MSLQISSTPQPLVVATPTPSTTDTPLVICVCLCIYENEREVDREREKHHDLYRSTGRVCMSIWRNVIVTELTVVSSFSFYSFKCGMYHSVCVFLLYEVFVCTYNPPLLLTL
jgi:hypothetical protein